MAIPSRLTSAARPIAKAARVISPTGIAVLLSVGAHIALLAFGPRTEVSFAALSPAAQEADAKETIVPLVQLSPGERNRLPSFAQPRREPPVATGLRSFSLPPGLPFSPDAGTIKRRPVPANTLPSPTNPTIKNLGPLGGLLPSGITGRLPFRFNIPTTQVPQRSSSSQPPVTALPANPPLQLPATTDNGVRLSTEGLEGSNNLPNSSLGTTNSAPRTLADALRDTEAAGVAANPGAAPNPSAAPAPGGQETPNQTGEPPANAPAAPPVIATAPAQDKPSPLMNGNEYDQRFVTEAEAEENTKKWLLATAEGREKVAQATAEIPVDSGFKSCREQPPVDGRIGVIANPDGTHADATVLKSTGYDVLNRLALSQLEYEDFGRPEVPTQYVVNVKVIDKPEECTPPPTAPPS